MKFKKTTLSNGLRVISIPVKESPAVMVLTMVETGSNYEDKRENGLSHFLEHMCFKGTTNRPKTSDIARELDGLGAENNAFTSNEYTGYYAKAARKHFPKLFDIISDLYLNPTIPADDLEKERGVIIEEISMYEDLPHRKVEDVLLELLYGDTSFGRPIAGTKENIRKFSREDFVNYRDRHYVADKTIVIVAGAVSQAEVESEAKKRFSNIPRRKKLPKPKIKENQKAPGLKIFPKKTDQTHMIMAFRAYPSENKKVPALKLLAEILGKGMSSRLFTKLRDELGACYYVRAGYDGYREHGLFAISTGINASRTEEVVKVILEECKKLAAVPVSEAELKKAKEHYVGHLYMGLETSDSVAEFYASQEVISGRPKNPREIEESIRRVTAKEVQAVAKDIFKEKNLNLAIVGDVADQARVQKALSLK